MSKLLLHPPVTTTSFTLHQGCGRPHQYDGEHGIDCQPCVDYVATLPADERIGQQSLRGPVPVQGATPQEREQFARLFTADRDAHSWRLVPADEATTPAGPSAADVEELERLRARFAELDAVQGAQSPAPAESPIESPAFRLGRATAEAGLPPANPYDARKAEGKQWKAGYDSHEASKQEPAKA